MSATPYYHFHLIGIEPGNEEFFEGFLENMTGRYRTAVSSFCWRTWKVMFGSDVPAYLICIFAKEKELLDQESKQLVFIEPSVKEVLRRHRQGRAILRRDMSYLPAVYSGE